MNERKPLWIGCLLFFLLIVFIFGFLIWRELRQERLSAQLLATVKEEPSLSAIDYYKAQDTTRPDREYFKPQILRNEATVVRLLQEGADPDVRDLAIVERPFWEKIKFLLKGILKHTSASADLSPSALAIAVQTNDTVIVTALLKAGARDVNAEITIFSDGGGEYHTQYPLINYSAYVGNLEIVKELCAHGADIHKLDSEGAPILQSALEGGTFETAFEKDTDGLVVQDRRRRTELFHLLLAKGAKYEANSKIGYALLSAAVAGDFLDLTRELLAAGVPPDAKPGWPVDSSDESPLDSAVANDDFTLVKLLLQYGASARDAILDARNPEMARLLLAHGADIHAVVKHGKREGENKLNFACMAGDTKMALFLIEHGLNPNSGGEYSSPIDEAAEYGSLEIVRLLLQHGAKVGPHSPGADALWLAIAESHVESAKLILRYGASPNSAHSPLAEAIAQGDASTALALLKCGANVNGDGGAALFAACESCDEDLVELLLEHGADPNVRSDDGTTAIQTAKQNADPPSDADAIIALLKEYGAKR
jgi:ankyrin repeat protein